MREKFANEFITKLNGKISHEELKIVLSELQLFINNYEISTRQTDLVPYNNHIPDCFKIYMVSKKIEGLSDGTLQLYNLCLNDFFVYTDKPINNLSTNDIRIYLYSLQSRRGLSNHSLDERRLILNSFFEWCQNEGYINRNPCRLIRPIKFEQKPRTPLNGLELALIRYACRTYREKAMIELLYSTGCRVSELVTLNKSDINFQKGEVRLFGKGKKHRISYINSNAEIAIKQYIKFRKDDNDALFVSDRKPHNRLSKSGVERVVSVIGDRSGIGRKLYPHLIRHTTATDALNRGMSISEVQKILGHEKLDTTMIYAKVSQDNIKFNHKKYIV